MASYNKNSNQDEYYIKENGKEVYAVKDGVQFYAKKKDKKEFFAINEHGKPYYAKRDNSEFYPKNKNGRDIFIQDGNVEIYAKDSKQAQIYPKRDGREFVLKKNGQPYYALNENQVPTYPKDKFGDEYVENNVFIKAPDGKKVLPILKNGRPKYPKSGNGEIYPLDDNHKPYFCKNREGDEVYAKNGDGDEYYPPNMYAKNRYGEYYYAIDRSHVISYPTNRNGEMYIETKEGSYPILKNFKHTFTYAKQKELEVYPTLYVNNKKMEIIIDTYAKVFNKGPYYPTDADLNEYTLPNGEFIEKKGYPITSDGYIIIPNVNNEPKLMTKNTSVSIDNIDKLLYRPGHRGYDFLTNVKSKRKAKNNVGNYKTLNFKKGTTSILYYVIAALTLAIIILISLL